MSESARNLIGKVAIIAAFVLCVGLGAILFWEYWAVGKFANDFGVYWRTANNPASQAYFYEGRWPFPYMPTMLLWITPLAFMSKWPAFILFGLFSTLILALAIRPYLSKPAVALTLLSPPFIRGLYTGQVSAALAAIMIWACGTSMRFRAGVAFGLIASVKPQLVIMAPLMLMLNKDWRAIAGAAGAFGFTMSVSMTFFGPERWLEWIDSFERFRSAVVDTPVIGVGVSPAIVALKYGLDPLPFLLAGIVAGAVLVFLCRDLPPLEKAAAIGAGSLLAAPYGLAYDLIIAVPIAAQMIMRGQPLGLIPIGAAFNPAPLLVAGWELLGRRPSELSDLDQLQPAVDFDLPKVGHNT